MFSFRNTNAAALHVSLCTDRKFSVSMSFGEIVESSTRAVEVSGIQTTQENCDYYHITITNVVKTSIKAAVNHLTVSLLWTPEMWRNLSYYRTHLRMIHNITEAPKAEFLHTRKICLSHRRNAGCIYCMLCY